MLRMLLLALCAVWPLAVAAEPYEIESLEEALEKLTPKAPPGALSWDDLGKADIVYNEKTGQLSATFPEHIRKLDGQTIKVAGFLFPVDVSQEPGESTIRYLLTALPPSCPFCLPAGPNYMMDMNIKGKVDFTYDPVLASGRLELREQSGDFFYILHEAQIGPMPK
jgi:hypothetical protein